MNLYIIGGAFALLVVILIIAFVVIDFVVDRNDAKKRAIQQTEKKEAERRKVDQWVEWIELAQTDKEILKIGELRNMVWKWTGERLNHAERKYRGAADRNVNNHMLASVINPVLEADEDFPLMIALLHVLRSKNMEACEKLGLSPINIRLRISQLFRHALENAKGDRDAFQKLHEFWFTYSDWCSDDKPYQKTRIWKLRGVLRYNSPEWDELVAKHIETPSIADFANTNQDPAKGEIRLLAAEALRARSLKDAKVVLAFCSTERTEYGPHSRQVVWPYLNEVGDVLLAELTKMVDQLHHEQGMFAQLEESM